MSIEYKFTVVSVDSAARCMEVIYEADGYPTMHIGARIPFEGESLDAVIQQYAPVRYWEELKEPLSPPAVGTTGTIVPPTPMPPTAQANKDMAESLLAATDWVNQPDVSSDTASPRLLNLDGFLTYRAAIRAIALNPVAGDLNWPTAPVANWA